MIMKNHTNRNTISVLFVFFFVLFSWIFMTVMSAENTTTPVKVGVILNFDSSSGENSNVYWSCMNLALTDFYASNPHYKTRLDLLPRNSNKTALGAAAAALDLINNDEVHAIIGPTTSMEAIFVVNLGKQLQVPILTFSASSPSLTSLRSSYFFRLTQNDLIQVKAISGIVQNFGWKQVVPIYEDSSYGEEIIPFLVDALQEVDAHVPYRSVVSESATDDQIEKELYKLMTMQTRVFVVHMSLELCSKLFSKAKEIGMMSENYVWIITSGISNRIRLISSSDLNSMEGVLGIQANIGGSPKHLKFAKQWEMKFRQENPDITTVNLDVYGLQAHDAISALAMAVEKVGNISIGYQSMSDLFNATDISPFKVSLYGPKIVEALSGIRFTGMAGEFNIVEGEIKSSWYDIINVIGGKAKRIALWTPEKGMVSTTNASKIFTNSNCIFEPMKWPGESYSVPKGWEIPTNRKKLRIGVPVGIPEFVKIIKDRRTNTTVVTGICIDVFKAAVELLPYALSYEFVPFENSNGSMNGTYDDLVYQVFLEKFDAVVGDTTITAKRSLHVDFTMPYIGYDVGMVVPIRYNKSKNAWIFLLPFKWGLWLTTLCYFILIAFVIWVLEHRVNEDFRGPPSHQVGTSFWFSFSTMVFSQRERVASNLARVVMTIWVFVMIILTQSYTANLSSLLTVQQLQPTIKDVNDLKKNHDNIGYIKNSYFHEVLIGMGFDPTRLKEIQSVEAGHIELTKGSTNGGIAALFVGTPVFDVFLAKYCSKYTMVGPIAKTNGFGFAFPKRSRLAADMSSAILNLTEGNKILNIEASWIKKKHNCQDSGSDNNSGNSLGLDSFWGLFLITGIASVFALIIFLTNFLCKHKHVMISPDSRASKWRRIRSIFETFDHRDVDYYTFRSSQQSKKFTSAADQGQNASPTSNMPENPVSYTSYKDHDSVFGCQQRPSTGGVSPSSASTIKFAVTI